MSAYNRQTQRQAADWFTEHMTWRLYAGGTVLATRLKMLIHCKNKRTNKPKNSLNVLTLCPKTQVMSLHCILGYTPCYGCENADANQPTNFNSLFKQLLPHTWRKKRKGKKGALAYQRPPIIHSPALHRRSLPWLYCNCTSKGIKGNK